MSNSNISDIEWREWSHHPVTQAFLDSLKSDKQDTMDAWARQAYVADTGEQTLAANASALGGVDVLRQLIANIEEYQNAA